MRTKLDIRRAIKERGYSIKEFADKIGVKPQNIIQNMINGNPTIKKLEELANGLDCDITDLFYPIDEEQIEQSNKDLQPTDASLSQQSTCIEQHSDNTLGNQLVTTTFCPHCGTKMRVGVVLFPEN